MFEDIYAACCDFMAAYEVDDGIEEGITRMRAAICAYDDSTEVE